MLFEKIKLSIYISNELSSAMHSKYKNKSTFKKIG